MILTNEKNYEEIVDIYGGFPLKENFLEAGNALLAQYGVQAELDEEEGVIKIPFVDRLLFDEDDLCGPDGNDEFMKAWRMKVAACIQLAENPEQGICDTFCEWFTFDPEDEDEEDYGDYYDPRAEEFDQGFDLISTFLNGTVDCGE